MAKKQVFPKMDPKWKARWVEALRSGDYVQGRNALRDTFNGKDKFCCLGVLCDIHTSVKWKKEEPGRAVVRTRKQVPSYERSSTGSLPDILRENLGVSTEAEQKLIGFNDHYGKNHKSFNGIADWIEENL